MVERMFEQMSRQFDEAAQLWGQQGLDAMGSATMGLGKMGIDLTDEGEEFVVTADVPGFEKDDVDVRVADDTLSINARREHHTEQQEGTYLQSEREHRSLSERVRFPAAVREDDISATLRNGVLTIHVPKAEATEARGRTVEIE
jgi:HSP20 family protein